ncbi:MAG: hypothetical protein KC417_18045, partial [Myxococcales bacterium]|nr:hypothetical protein [Myxococcales bacterium]
MKTRIGILALLLLGCNPAAPSPVSPPTGGSGGTGTCPAGSTPVLGGCLTKTAACVPANGAVDRLAVGSTCASCHVLLAGSMPTMPPINTRPSAANTGWQPTGVTLTNTGSINVTVDGTVIDSKNVSGCITVNARNVTIRRSKITTNSTCIHGITVQRSDANLLVEDVEVDATIGTDYSHTETSGAETCISGSGFTARRVNLHGCRRGAYVVPYATSTPNVTIDASYIHNLDRVTTYSRAGVTSYLHSNFTLRNNSIDATGGNTDWGTTYAIFVGIFDEIPVNIAIDGNYINGGTFGLNGGYSEGSTKIPENMRVTNNQFGSNFLGGTHN